MFGGENKSGSPTLLLGATMHPSLVSFLVVAGVDGTGGERAAEMLFFLRFLLGYFLRVWGHSCNSEHTLKKKM